MGVDRTWDLISAVGNELFGGFQKADLLWSNVQQNMIDYVNQNGGHATHYTPPTYVARPKWNVVKDFLLGNKSQADLINALGCL